MQARAQLIYGIQIVLMGLMERIKAILFYRMEISSIFETNVKLSKNSVLFN
jgi:hypothetical protein